MCTKQKGPLHIIQRDMKENFPFSFIVSSLIWTVNECNIHIYEYTAVSYNLCKARRRIVFITAWKIETPSLYLHTVNIYMRALSLHGKKFPGTIHFFHLYLLTIIINQHKHVRTDWKINEDLVFVSLYMNTCATDDEIFLMTMVMIMLHWDWNRIHETTLLA